ncbi:adenylate/guanylate cyclase domain-containing protein [Argonema antarcticum]|uniref:adenylate/guanylate cyclase domain-containing protein n=1 Tax=Argonema antarcticum TaxID=2942763 RepID=UPI0020126CDC|nr:adenylate/guanylate cyclase domain-containing protein [Argonema antarcticum]MCL1470544.1 adenylate/guanylate cyclase domain-containing protein [Argonema antarcticum A004/B2]
MSENLVTMVFTDLVSSTAIKLNLPGSDITESNRIYRDTILLPHRGRVEDTIAAYGGRKVETIGDAFFLVFASPVQALQWAIAIQLNHINDPIPTPLGPLQVTIGMHTGSPLPDGGNFIGHEVDYTARVAALASAGQILLSEVTEVLVRLSHSSGFGIYRHSDRNLKGIGSVPIFEVLYNNKQPQPLKDNLKPEELKNIQQAVSIVQTALATQTQTENLTYSLSPDIRKQLETLLAVIIGPIAKILIEQTLEQASTPEDLVERLSVHVPEPSRKQFQEKAKTLLKK